MAGSNINRIVLTGNLTADPVLRSLPSGAGVCNFSIAVNSREKRGEEWRDRVDFFDCVVFGAQADNLARYKAKGEPVAVDGRLRQERWEKDGVKHQRVVVKVDSVQFLPSKPREGSPSGGGDGYGEGQPAPGSSYAGAGVAPTGAYGGQQPTGNDDIPF